MYDCCFRHLDELLTFEFISADFGGSIGKALEQPRLIVIADPVDGCSELSNMPAELADCILLVERYLFIVYSYM